jgi:hypothetical protein
MVFGSLDGRFPLNSGTAAIAQGPSICVAMGAILACLARLFFGKRNDNSQ